MTGPLCRWASRWASWTIAAAALVAGCATPEEANVTNEPKVPKSAAGVERPRVPAGTQLVVSMDERISSTTAIAGAPFGATVKTPLATADGTVLVPKGASLKGRIVAVDTGESPSLRIAFDSVETARGSAPISARVVASDEYGFTVGAYDFDPDVTGYDTILYPGRLGVGGGPEGSVPTPRRDVETIVLPAGGELKLMLTRPLWAPPGAR